MSSDQLLNDDEVALELIRSGQRFVEMIEPKCYEHKGEGADLSSIWMNSLAMVDLKSYYTDFPDMVPQAMGQDDIRKWPNRLAPLFVSFANKKHGFSAHELLLMPRRVKAYVFRTREWVEENLTDNFKKAMKWNAVLLIDEADVFMERRTTSDLTRNSLVADFSDDERQRVWRTFIDKLGRERGETIRLTMDAKEYIESTRMQALKWNGREIRNAFQTAVALAEYEADKDSEGRIKVKDDHLKAVVDLSKDFKSYLKDLHRKDEGKRAEHRHERLDSFEGSK
ncbi:Lon protease [Colletotrichum sp. SAR 10_86]|nr:Lon protease [Colletotrichum sp. SAR 10_86]